MHYFTDKMSLNLQILHHQYSIDLSSKCKYVHLKIHWAPQIMHQNIAIILQLLNYTKIRIAVLVKRQIL